MPNCSSNNEGLGLRPDCASDSATVRWNYGHSQGMSAAHSAIHDQIARIQKERTKIHERIMAAIEGGDSITEKALQSVYQSYSTRIDGLLEAATVVTDAMKEGGS